MLNQFKHASRFTGILCSLLLATSFAFAQPQADNRSAASDQKFTLSGYVRDAANGEELIGVTVYITQVKNGVITNPYGFYSITLPQGSYTVRYSYLGYQSVSKEIALTGNQEINLELVVEASELAEVEVVAEKEEEDANVQEVKMSRNQVNIEMVKQLPALFGEPDVIKTIQMMPGVISAGEGTSGFFVRGGSADQNLILIDEAPVYDASHLFGLFSVFNADVIKDSELYKGGIPAQFGGRLSSILDIRTKDGNNKQLAGNGSISNLAAKVMLEGPLVKEKSSFIVSARRSYADLFLKLSSDPNTRENSVFFYDLNAKVNWKPNNKNRVFVAAYVGRDVFKFGNDARFGWGNATSTVRWNHLFNERLFSNTTALFSNFDYLLEVNSSSQGFTWTANLQEASLKEDFTYFLSPKVVLNFGGSASYRRFNPGTIEPESASSIFTYKQLQKYYAFDYAAYLGTEQTISAKLSLQYGVRLSVFQNIGSGTFNQYKKAPNGQPDNVDIEIVSSKTYGRWEPVKTFANLEPRFSARYLLSANSSVKASYNRMVQNLHLLSNSTVPIPFNTWTPSSPYLDPQKADQFAIGYFRNFKANAYEFSAEVYYKEMNNVTDFADNANLLLNDDVAAEFRQGFSDSYGLELFLQKNKGRLTGFASYTLSKTERTVPDVNGGKTFVANYDRRNVLNLAATYVVNDKWTIGGNFTYATGRPITLPSGRYEMDGGYVLEYYTERNSYRLPDNHRLDLSATLEPRKNAGRKWKQSWVFSIYNVYNRKNPFTIYTRIKQDDEGNIIGDGTEKEARLVYLFPILPSVAWKVRF